MMAALKDTARVLRKPVLPLIIAEIEERSATSWRSMITTSLLSARFRRRAR